MLIRVERLDLDHKREEVKVLLQVLVVRIS